MHRVGLVFLALGITAGCGRLGFAPTEGDGGAADDGADGDAMVDAAGPASPPRSISASSHATCAVLADGTLWCWGDNTYGTIGNGTLTTETAPIQIGTDTWISISGSAYTQCGVRSDSTLWCWGNVLFGSTVPVMASAAPTPSRAPPIVFVS